MKFIELIDSLRNIDQARKLMESLLPNVEFEQIDTYLKDNLSIESDLILVDAETSPDNTIWMKDGNKYINLFPLTMLQEMVESYQKSSGQNKSHIIIAQKILDYRINDA